MRSGHPSAAVSDTSVRSKRETNIDFLHRLLVIGLSEHLLECNLSEEQSEFADSILESAKFLLTLINDVLDFSKIESGHMDVETIPFSPSKLINDVIVPLKLQAKEKGLDLNSDCDLPPDEILLGDPWRMRQILTNLVGNSLKFTAQGHVDLSVRTLAQDDPEIRSMQFFVRDTGVGIEKEVMKDLFKPFHQADSSTARLHGGTGLGLVICRQLVELMGGHIHLEPNPGGGTTAICSVPFSVYHGPTSDVQASTALPRRAQPPDEIEGSLSLPISPENETHEVEERKRPAGSTDSADAEPDAHVLLVEDNPVNRKVIALAIKKLGYTVSTACDGQEALEYLCRQSQQKQSIKTAVVIMDCQMPNIDGYEATRRIRRDRVMFDDVIRSLPIIALTASAIKGDKEKCWKAGMDDYLTKPAARDALERALFKWTAVKRPTDSDRLDQKPGGGFVDENDQDTKALPKE
jgi:CheY-like chemotaxis protein